MTSDFSLFFVFLGARIQTTITCIIVPCEGISNNQSSCIYIFMDFFAYKMY